MPLTDARIKGLKPHAIRYMVSDGYGLSLDVLASGKMTWIYRYRLNGKQERVTLGQYPDLSLKAAREERDKLAAEKSRGKSPATEKKMARLGLSQAVTLREFGDRYFKEQVENRLKTANDLKRYLTAEIYPSLGGKRLRDINPLTVQQLVYRKRDHGRPAAAMRIRMVLKQVFAYAIEKHLVETNPATNVAPRYIGKVTRRTRNLKPAEIREYLSVIYGSSIRRQFKLALHLYLHTTVRKSMLLLARWPEIDFETGEWTVPKEHMKGPKGEEHEHVVYMSKQVQTLFRELRVLAGDSDYVLPGRNRSTKPFAKNALNKAIEGLTFNMEHFTIHDLRRTASTQLREHGFNEDVVEKALSHEKTGVAGIYNRAQYAEERRKMLQWWSDYIDGLMTESKVIVGHFGAA